MKRTLISVLCCIALSSYAQKLKKITVKNKAENSKEVFYVYKSDRDIRQGEYQKSYYGKIAVKGQYRNNKKVGVWKFFDSRQDLVQKINFPEQELIYDRSLQSNTLKNDTANVSMPAVYLGGMNQIYRIIGRSLRYPPEARRKGIQGKVMVEITIDEEGRATGFEIAQRVGAGCDEEAVRVLKMVPDEWIPAKDKDGKPIRCTLTLPIIFKLA